MAEEEPRRKRSLPEAGRDGDSASDDEPKQESQRPRFGSPFSDPTLRLALAKAIVTSAQQHPSRVARGNFGCIYAPAPACLDGSRKTFSPTAVGKLAALDDDYRTEAEVLARLERIDPERRHHVAYYGACTTADRPDCPLEDDDEDEEEDELDDDEEAEAELKARATGSDPVRRQGRERGLLVMERAEPLDPQSYPEERLPDALSRLWEGLEAMGAAGIRYEDLHAGNLLVGDDGLWRMVDFGACTLDADPEETQRIHAREMRLFLEATFPHTRIARRWVAWLEGIESRRVDL
jgi:hypothetical protein